EPLLHALAGAALEARRHEGHDEHREEEQGGNGDEHEGGQEAPPQAVTVVAALARGAVQGSIHASSAASVPDAVTRRPCTPGRELRASGTRARGTSTCASRSASSARRRSARRRS